MPNEPDAPPHPAAAAPPALPSDRATLARADWVSQSTAVEQARAVAEVQAAIVVAQQCPRDMDRALAEMRDSCGRMALAERAFYAVPNRGRGPSVHLARELARIWGNIDYGVKELRRDDARGESEVLAYCWDQQTNVRSARSFIAPHARMVNKKRTPLVDLGDIYLSNQNVGARAVRECIMSTLPPWFVEEAQDRCRATIERGEGKPLEQRKADMLAAFALIGVDQRRLEAKIGAPKGQWTAAHVADMLVVHRSITRDGQSVDELLPGAPKVSAAEIAGGAS